MTLVRSLEIDVAVDLMGFTGDSRPTIFAARLAPVQVSYLGYPGTMGAPWMDYLLADAIVIPEAKRSDYSECVAYMPHCYQANPSWEPVTSTRTRKDFSLPNKGFVFCSFNNNFKITPDVFAIWMRLLERVPGSVLWLYVSNATAGSNLRREAERSGVSAARLVFAEKVSHAEHVVRHQHADLFLDTLYWNAHTTASDALRAGLPVLTCEGDAFASRVAASLCRCVGLHELVTTSPAEYEATALALASNPERMASLRAQLALGLPQSTLFDAKGFARDMEALYTAMYDRRRACLPVREES